MIAKVNQKKALFISYNGALEPLLQSQGIPYLQGLSKKGINFVLLTFEKIENLKNRQNVINFKNRLKDYNIDWYWLVYHKKPYFWSTAWDILLGLIFSFYLVLAKRIKVVHCRSYVPAVIGIALKKVFTLKFIFDMRGIMGEEFVEAEIWSKDSISFKLVKSWEKRFLLLADEIIVLSKQIKEIIEKVPYLKNRTLNIEVISCCVDCEKFNKAIMSNHDLKLPHLKNKITIVYIGSVGTWYMLKEMIDFFIVYKKRFSNAHFLFINRDNQEMIKSTLQDKGVNKDDFTILGAFPEEVPNYLSQATIGMFFIKPVSSKKASSPTKFAEYLISGLPVVINSDIGDTEELVRANKIGVVVREFNKESYEKAVDELSSLLIKEGDNLKMRCRKTVEAYLSLDNGINKYTKVYQRIYNSRIK